MKPGIRAVFPNNSSTPFQVGSHKWLLERTFRFRSQPIRRYASTQPVQSVAATRAKSIAISSTAIFVLAAGYCYVTDTRASVHRWMVVPVMRWLYPDAEAAHYAGTQALKGLWNLGLHPRERGGLDDGISVEVY